jgi:hypothetical protein
MFRRGERLLRPGPSDLITSNRVSVSGSVHGRRLRLLKVSPEVRRQEVRGASMGSAHGRNSDKSPRPD